MQRIKRVDVRDTSRFFAYVAGILGVLLGIVYAFGGLIMDSLVSLGVINGIDTPGLSTGTILAFAALIGMPIIFLILGACFGAILAFAYNSYAKRFGGISIEWEDERSGS